MTKDTIEKTVNYWNNWAIQSDRYDVALLKIWIQFENYLRELFIAYSTGEKSERGYQPELKLKFESEEQLNAFLRGDRQYIEYLERIERLSKHIFCRDPFEIIFMDEINKSIYEQVKAIRNYVAHESGEARIKLINKCFSGNAEKFLEPNEYLKTMEKLSKQSYYTYYVSKLQEMIELLIDPPED